MKKYSMTCTCGDVMTVDVASRDEAVEQFSAMMTEDAVAKHFAEKHPGQPVFTQEQVRQGLQALVVEAAA